MKLFRKFWSLYLTYRSQPYISRGYILFLELLKISWKKAEKIIVIENNFSGQFADLLEKTAVVLKAAISHNGYALVDIFDPCVSFNKINTFKWYKENTYKLEGNGTKNRLKALDRAFETEKYPPGIFLKRKESRFSQNRIQVTGITRNRYIRGR